MVFMSHGLQLAFFVFTAATAATGLWRAGVRLLGFPTGWIAAGLTLILLGVRSLAAAVYGAVALPAVALLRPRLQLGLAAAVVGLTLIYPMLRGANLFPTATVVELSARVDAARAASLATRFAYEDQLLARASERLWFGWGTWARNRVYDLETGENRSVTDGDWIIRLGTQGAVGLAATFGLLLGPVLSAFRRRGRLTSGAEWVVVAATAWIVALSGVDLLPNAMLTPLLVLFSGALAGVMEGTRRRPVPRPAARRPAAGASGARDGARGRQSSRIGATGGPTGSGSGSGPGPPIGVQVRPS
jgi:O-antigen ligase